MKVKCQLNFKMDMSALRVLNFIFQMIQESIMNIQRGKQSIKLPLVQLGMIFMVYVQLCPLWEGSNMLKMLFMDSPKSTLMKMNLLLKFME